MRAFGPDLTVEFRLLENPPRDRLAQREAGDVMNRLQRERIGRMLIAYEREKVLRAIAVKEALAARGREEGAREPPVQRHRVASDARLLQAGCAAVVDVVERQREGRTVNDHAADALDAAVPRPFTRIRTRLA